MRDVSFWIMCSMIVFLPLARGGMHPWAWTIMQVGVAVCLVLLLIQSIKSGCPVFETTPLTRPLIVLILLSTTSTIFSDYKLYAWEGFMLLLTYIGAYFITQTVVRTRTQQRIMIYTIIATALILCMIGLLKRFSLNPFPIWDYNELKYNPNWVASTYTNHNHLAGFLEMAIPFVFALFLTRSRSLTGKLLLIYIVLILLVTQALTLSRGGWVSTFVSIAFMGLYLLRQKTFHGKKLVLSIAGTAIIISLFTIASTPVVERALSLAEQDESASMEGRLDAWKGTIDLIQTSFLLGTGPGTYEAAFIRFQPAGLRAMFIQAHNDYLQALSDVGVCSILLVAILFYIFFRSFRKNLSHSSRQVRGFTLALSASVLAIGIHSVVDFNLHIPSNAFIFCILWHPLNISLK